jgi:hypothetical protein
MTINSQHRNLLDQLNERLEDATATVFQIYNDIWVGRNVEFTDVAGEEVQHCLEQLLRVSNNLPKAIEADVSPRGATMTFNSDSVPSGWTVISTNEKHGRAYAMKETDSGKVFG